MELDGEPVMSSGGRIRGIGAFWFGIAQTNTEAARACTLKNRWFSGRVAESGLTEIKPDFREKKWDLQIPTKNFINSDPLLVRCRRAGSGNHLGCSCGGETKKSYILFSDGIDFNVLSSILAS